MPVYDFNDGNGPVPAHQHPKGGGWVADTAHVDATAFVGWQARVYGNAEVRDRVSIGAFSYVCENAGVFGGAILRDYAAVVGFGRVCGIATIENSAVITGNAAVGGDTIVSDNAIVGGEAQLHGSSRITGAASIYGRVSFYDCIIGGNFHMPPSPPGVDRCEVRNEHLTGEIGDEVTVPPLPEPTFFYSIPINFPDECPETTLRALTEAGLEEGRRWVQRNCRSFPYGKILDARVDQVARTMSFFWADAP